MASLTVQFTNNSGVDDSLVSIGFVPGASNAGFTIQNVSDQTALLPLNIASDGTYPFNGNWYALSALPKGVTISAFSGRVYVAYGPEWAVEGAGYEPAQAVTDPNFYLRYDKLEMTFTGQPADVANLTSIDYWSIPLSLTTSSSGTAVQTVSGLLGSTTAQNVFDALNPLTTPPVSGVTGPGGTDGAPLPALVPGDFLQYGSGPVPGTTFARLIGPSSYPPIQPVSIPVTPYDTWQDYLQYLATTFGPGTTLGAVVPTLGNGVIATIAGQFAGVGPNPPATGPLSPQSYNLSATIDANLDITLTGTLGGISGTTTMLYKVADLTNPSGIYGGNTPYYLNGATSSTNPGNDVYGWVGGDLFSGLNIGAVGSTTIVDSGSKSMMVGSLNSQQWFGLASSQFFAGLQSSTYYNQWAATLAPLSQAYNFAYSDRFAAVFASLNPAKVDTLTITLEGAAVDMGS
ncbi:beta-1,3-glucanase family protein [Andreprevotia chitinilytica]|uniref:beta-1,3-glucanase family protein n=1 Tax=Andreprevotia chitinilytica TaxID=396808 RepID=UPI0005594893|nr:beta-1,3-glucanase family protein [Andreprevotia chitinilytica]